MSLVIQNSSRCCLAIFSHTLQRIEVNETGRQFLQLFFAPFLCNGIMSACFQQSGILPRENDILKILQIDIANVSAQFFSINGP